jgi:plasmid stabilization system protein ParE
VPKRYRVEITRTAERDLLGIYDYIERDSRQRALKWFREIERQIRTLSRSPKRCPVIPESEEIGREYRHLIYGSYRTIFRVEGEGVYVLRVVHGARLLDTSTLE